MSRRRNRTSAETGLSPELRGPFIDFSGSTSHGDDDFLELEPDEELLCSVSEIAEHLGRNITVVLETALSEIRKMVSIRIRVLKMELREKTLEVDDLKARLDAVQRDSKDAPLRLDCRGADRGGRLQETRPRRLVQAQQQRPPEGQSPRPRGQEGEHRCDL
ncbi:hypothetical protein FQA47_001522 [Oryzias melastigma]|uniref:Uncharacterized protein n=1 Tax=Oryzias melastigma TaxID=30732 RepID=A0A834L2P8_ORYME|nr:hypothetical protein FQA47_001522 [Oryzias melastigma]